VTCYHPIQAYRSTSEKTATGKCKILFTNSGSKPAIPLQVNCGRCIGCRLEYSRQWAVRLMHESSLQDDNCFITLTYDDEHLPWDHNLNKRHFQLFMKRFRKMYAPKKIRFYQSGEYGEPTPDNDFIARPHYHAIIFNHSFTERELYSEREGLCLYNSPILDNLWGHGTHNLIGDVSFESCAYVARYIMKKITGAMKHEHYLRTDHTTGQPIEIVPEYATMSRGGRTGKGLGSAWFDQYKTDCYPSDTLSIRGAIQRPPKYYDYLLDLESPGDIELIKQARKTNIDLKNSTPERLATRETVKKAQLNQLVRKL
jgi:hypothetical protein